jgi:phosphohistidine phosphatase
MRLMLLRHAKAEKAEPGERDHERALNARGHKDSARMGAYLAKHALVPDGVLVSTARRTRETWDGVAEAFPGDPAVRFDERLYNGTSDGILAVLRETKPAQKSLLVIGHNPGMHDLATLLIASGDVEARERLNEGLPTAGLAIIDFAPGSWAKLHPHGGRLERFVTPRSLAENGAA